MNGSSPASSRYLGILARILLLAAILRAALTVYAQSHPSLFDFPDAHRYVRVARDLIAGNPNSSQLSDPSSPWDFPKTGTDWLYPRVFAGVLLVHDLNDDTLMLLARIFNGLSGLAAILMLAGLARQLFNEQVALVSALIFSIEPILLFFTGLVLTEWMYICFLLAMVHTLVRFAKDQRIIWILAFGLVSALATWTRSTNLWLPVIMFFGVIPLSRVHRGEAGRIPAGLAAFLLTYVVLLTPPILFRYQSTHKITWTRTGNGASLLEALGPWADGGPGMNRIEFPPVPPDADEIARDRIYRRAALDWAAQHPSQTLQLAISKLGRTWSLTMNASGFQAGTYKIISIASTLPVFLLALVGIWCLRRRADVLVLLLLPAAYFSLIHMVFVGSIRYRLPAMPFVFILAAVGWCALLGRKDPVPLGGANAP